MLATLARGLASPQFGALVVLASAATLGVGLILWSLRPDYVPVADQTSQQDVMEIISVLNSTGVQYKVEPGSGLVLIPQDQLAQARMNLAASGLPKNAEVGLEQLYEEPSLGISHFNETARYQQGLETELSRTISSMRNVESARVHLAQPEQSVFVRDRVQASASVMVRASVGRKIEDEQVNAIASLVASSIPYLEMADVAVVDQWGRLLSSGDDDDSGVTRKQYEYARKLERLYASRIEELLVPMIGAGRVRAIVTADVDFSTNEQTQESFDPDPQQLRSEQTEQQNATNGAAGGVPGALTNQPPGNGTTDPDLAQAGEGGGGTQSSTAIRNYELDKTITHTRQSPGAVQRLSAAVVIDDLVSLDEEGNTVRTPVNEEAMAEYTAMVREAMGFDQERGDSVVVFNRSFQPAEEVEPVEPLPLWQQDWVWNGVRQSFIGLAVLLLVLLVLRPAVKRLSLQSLAAPAEKGENTAEAQSRKQSQAALEGSKDVRAIGSPPVVYGDILNMARAMAAEDPKRVAVVVKDWVREN